MPSKIDKNFKKCYCMNNCDSAIIECKQCGKTYHKNCLNLWDNWNKLYADETVCAYCLNVYDNGNFLDYVTEDNEKEIQESNIVQVLNVHLSISYDVFIGADIGRYSSLS